MNKKVVLIADDDEMNRTIIRRFLKKSFEILEAEDGNKAMDIISSTPVDALLLDIIMPGMDGLQVLERVRAEEKYRNLGILVATSTKEKTERHALALGADDVVSKPYDPVIIEKRLENILIMKEAQTQQELLKSNNVEEYVREEKQKLVAEVGSSMDRLHKIADIINQNIENEKLIKEMAEDIHQEADRVESLISLD